MYKPNYSRRTVLGGLGATAMLPIIPIRSAKAAEFTVKFGHDLAADHPMNVRALEASKRVLERTGGSVELAVYPSNALGGQTDMISQIRSGGTEFVAMSGVILGTFIPVAAISGIGFAFKNYEQVWSAMDGSLGKLIKREIENTGLIAFDKVWDNGFRQTTTGTRPINGPDDFKGMKLRVPVARLWTSLFSSLGASPASINFNETYGALQTKVVDGMENSLATLFTSRIYEVQKYCSMTNHMWDGFWMLANKRALAPLPEKSREILFEELTRAILEERADSEKLNQSLASDLKAKGMIFNDTQPDPFRTVLVRAGFYDTWRKTYGQEAWSVLESNVGELK